MTVIGANGSAVPCSRQKLVTIHHGGMETDTMIYIMKGSSTLMGIVVA